MLFISCVQESDKGCCLSVVSKRGIKDAGYQLYPRGQGCGITMPDLSDLVPFHSGQHENINLLVLGQVQTL